MPELHSTSGTLRHQFDWTDAERPSTAVVTAVAAEESTDPLELEPLQCIVDTDALNALFRPGDSPEAPSIGSVRFEYLGYEIVLDSRGGGALYETSPDRATGQDPALGSVSTD